VEDLERSHIRRSLEQAIPPAQDEAWGRSTGNHGHGSSIIILVYSNDEQTLVRYIRGSLEQATPREWFRRQRGREQDRAAGQQETRLGT
jgi:hypothetical protein